MISIRTLAIALASTAIVVLPARASSQASSKIATATRTESAPDVDGRLDEALWSRAVRIDDFTQQSPVAGADPSERTEIYLVYDDEALYVGARMLRQDPDAILRTMTRRDGFGAAERITITLDPQRDRRTGVGFGVTAAGVRSDHRHTQDDDRRGRESQFEPVWTAAARVDSTGWSAEMRIPFSQLRFPAVDNQQWGLQLDRWMPDKNEDVQWAMIPPSETGFISRFGTLQGISNIPSTRPIELLPYVAADATRRGATTETNPLVRNFNARIGGDLKMAVGSSLTLDATVNPDFGQVEADPAEVNLSAFETFFEERRPFFIEGGEMLSGSGGGGGGGFGFGGGGGGGGGPSYFYPRRIGAAPHASVSADFVDVPRASTILGAAKITGRLPSRLSVGGLVAVTAQEDARLFFTDSVPQTRRAGVEPLTAYSVLRLQQEVGSQASTIAAAFTTTNRRFGSDTHLAELLAREAYYGGLDWRIRMQEGRYAISGNVAGSYVAGDTGAVRRLQTASTRYLQRPDMTHGGYDPLKTSLSGYSARLRADKDAGDLILWSAEVKAESPGFEMNDLGRLQSTDDIEYSADLRVRETEPGRYFQNWQFGFETRGARTFGGIHQENSWTQNTELTLKSFWRVSLRSTLELATLDDALTRGGPLMGKPRVFKQDLRMNSAFGAPTFWRLNVGYDVDEFDAVRTNFGGQLTVRPTDRVSVSVEPSYQNGTDPRQYVTQVAGGTRTFGTRYIFGAIERTTLSAKLRVNYTVSPNLSFEAYGEPFVASGGYENMGELLAPRSRNLRLYGTDGTTVTLDSLGTRTVVDGAERFTIESRDFHVLSFRSNVVMRWEWNPGSTLFVVWQQNRRTSEAFQQSLSLSELYRTTRAAGDNFLSVKLSYWLPVSLGGGRQ